MTEANASINVKRILVSLDNSTHSLAALEAAVELAQQYNAELKGVFIEDITLLNLAKMPFCQEVGEHTAMVRNMTTDGVSRGIYVQSRWVIQSFRKKTNSTGLNSAFVVLRGNVHKTIERESQQCDLIVLGKTGTNPLRARRLGSTARALIKNHTKPLLLIEAGSRLGYPMMVAYRQTPLGKISLETARDLLNPEETLIILLCEDDPGEFSDDVAYLKQWAGEHKVNITIQGFKSQAIKRFIRMLNGMKTGLLILPHDEDEPGQTLTQECLEGISLPILLVRASG